MILFLKLDFFFSPPESRRSVTKDPFLHFSLSQSRIYVFVNHVCSNPGQRFYNPLAEPDVKVLETLSIQMMVTKLNHYIINTLWRPS